MALRVYMECIGRSQRSEFFTGSSRNGPFDPSLAPWPNAATAMRTLFNTWTGGTLILSEDALTDWCWWDGVNAGSSFCIYDPGTDTFTANDWLNTLVARAASRGSQSAGDADMWWCPCICMMRTNLRPENTVGTGDQRDALMVRMITFIGEAVRNAFIAAGGRSNRFKLWLMPQINMGNNDLNESRRALRVFNGILGYDDFSGFTPITWLAAASSFSEGSYEGVHNYNYQNYRTGMRSAVALTRQVGGPNFVGAKVARVGQWWRVDSTHVKVPVFHSNGGRIFTGSPLALKWDASPTGWASTKFLTADSYDTSQASIGRTVVTCSYATAIPDGAYLFYNHMALNNGTFPNRPWNLDVTPELDMDGSDFYPGFKDIYSYVPPSSEYIADTFGAQLAASDPGMGSWNGAVDPHPSAGGVRSVTILNAADLGTGALRATIGVSGGVSRVQAQLSRFGVVQQTKSVAIASTADVTFTGLAPGTGYQIDVWGEHVARTTLSVS